MEIEIPKIILPKLKGITDSKVANAIIATNTLTGRWWWSCGLKCYYNNAEISRSSYNDQYFGVESEPEKRMIIIPHNLRMSFNGVVIFQGTSLHKNTILKVLEELGLYKPQTH